VSTHYNDLKVRVSGGRVDARQLQTMRKLTPESAAALDALLEKAWTIEQRLDSALRASRQGFRDPEFARRREEKAVACVSN
jgi:hypothetical protein